MTEQSSNEKKTHIPDSGKDSPFQGLKDFSATFKIPKFPAQSDKVKTTGDAPSYPSRDELVYLASSQELKEFAANFKLPKKNPADPEPAKSTGSQAETGSNKTETPSTDSNEGKA